MRDLKDIIVAAAVREVALRKRPQTTRGALRQAEEALEKAVAELQSIGKAAE